MSKCLELYVADGRGNIVAPFLFLFSYFLRPRTAPVECYATPAKWLLLEEEVHSYELYIFII